MKALLIGGTGTISLAITKQLSQRKDWEVYLLNRGNRKEEIPANVTLIEGDIRHEEEVQQKLNGLFFDCVCDFICFNREQVEADYRLFHDKTKQFIYISSASAYQKPCQNYLITEETPLRNPYWEYSRNKAACERFLIERYHQNGFPVTIVRPSHTYDNRKLPVAIHGNYGSWSVIKRMMEGKKVLLPGDGNSLWVMTYHEDFAKGFIGLMNNPKAIGEAYHITSDEVLTWNQAYETMAKILGVKLNPYYVPSTFLAEVGKGYYDYEGALLGDKANSVVFDNSKIKQTVPGFCCTTSFEQGARMAIEFCLTHPEYQVPDPEFDSFCDRVITVMEEAKNKLL